MIKSSIYNVYSFIKTGIFILILSVFTSMMYAEVMDNSVDVFYIQHNHPRLKNGENDMGRLIIQNNNSDGFHVVLSSDHAGQIVPVSTLDSESNIEYRVRFEQLSGRIGDGMTLDTTETDLLTNHYLLTGTSQTSSTDVAIKVIVTLYGYDEDELMAGKYRDIIDVDYINNN